MDGRTAATDAAAADAATAAAAADSGREVHIGQGICAPAKMDWAVEKMTELGATSITPLLGEKGKYDSGARQLQRWQRLIIAACEQCGRNRLPLLHPPQSVLEWRGDAEKRIVLTPRGAQPLAAVLSMGAMKNTALPPLSLAVGGESGFSRDEEEGLIAAGFVPATLGARILRSETAALAALALLQLSAESAAG